MLVYDRRKTLVSMIIGRYGIITANTVCNTGEIIIKNFTNLTGIIHYSVPFLKYGFTAAKISLVRNEMFSRFPESLLFGTTVTSFSKICWFRLFANRSRQISLFSVCVPFYFSLFISGIQHIFLVKSTSETAVHVRKRRVFFKDFLLHGDVLINDVGKLFIVTPYTIVHIIKDITYWKGNILYGTSFINV